MSVSSTIDLAPWFQQMREEKPIYFDAEFPLMFNLTGTWQVFRYQDIQKILNDPDSFSSEILPKIPEELFANSIVFTDPPRHKLLRSLVNKAFIPSVINRLEGWIRSYCKRKLTGFLDIGQMDFINDFADFLPYTVIAELLGVPEEYHGEVASLIIAIAGDPAVYGFNKYKEAQIKLGELLMGLVYERKNSPQQDLLSHLLLSEIDGEKLSMSDLLAFCATLLIGGTETTVELLANAMLIFIENPELQQHLILNPENIPKAINEVLRFRAPIISIHRTIKQDLELGGCQLRKGDYINLWLASANRDPAVFPAPDTFNIDRDNTKILSFGHGIHFCIGALLAKMEARIALETVFRYMKNIHLLPNTVISRIPSTVVHKLSSLPITFELQ